MAGVIEPNAARSLIEHSGRVFVHPNVPGDWTNDLVFESLATRFQGELNLAMVIALVPNHMLQDRSGWS